MNVTVTLFSGIAGWIVGLLAFAGVVGIVSLAGEWARDRFEVTWLSLPRLRWDRKGVRVRTPSGDVGQITYVIDDEAAGNMAIVCVHDENDEAHPAWFPVSSLTPAGRLEGEAA